VGSIPITRSNPSQGQPATAESARSRGRIEVLAEVGLRWLPVHTQPQFRCVTASLVTLTPQRARMSTDGHERTFTGK